MASSFLKKKAEEQAKKIDKQYGQDAYGGSKWREERTKESSGSNAAGASSPSSTTQKETSTTKKETTGTTTTNRASSSLQKRARAQAQKVDERDGGNAYGGSKWRETQVARNNAVSNATPVADKSKPNSGYSIDAIRQNLNDSYTNVEAAAKRLSDYAASYNAPAEDWFDQLVTKYGGQQDETGTYIFSDQATLDAFAKERDAVIAEITKAEQEYSALYDEYNNLYSQYNEWNDLAENYKSDAGFFEIAGNAIKSGLAQADAGFFGSLDLLEQTVITKPLGALLGNDELYKNGIFYGIHNYYSDLKEYDDQQLADSLIGKGKAAQIAAELGVGATAAAPNAILAWMTGGTSAAAQGTAALTGAASTGLGATISNAVTSLAKNPLYWSSFAQTLGPDYEAAINNGATELQASATALISSLLNAGVEISGGIEVLPARLQAGDTNAILQWVKSMPEEGLEEVIQRMVSGSTDKAIYDYDKPIYSATDPNAIINPKEMGKEFGMGAGVAAILGGVQTAVVKGSQAINNRQLGKIGSEYQVAAEDVIAEGLTFSEDSDAYKVATELQAKQEAGKTISDAEIGKQVVANQQAINKEQSIAEANKDPLETLVELAKETVEEQNKIDLSEDMGQESSTQKASVPYNAMSMENPARQKALIDKQALTKKLGYGENGMKLFNEIAAETDIDQQELMVRFDTPYQAGLTGLPMEKANLFDNFQTEAYNAGRLDHIARMAKDEQAKPAVIYSEAESGFDFSKAPSDLTQEQKDFGDFMAKAFGVKGEFNGYEGVDYNAKYNKSTGVVAFAQDFGIDPTLMKKLGSMDYQQKVEKLSAERGNSYVFYIAHEIADHVAANRAPAAMRAFNNAMYNYKQSKAGEGNLARERQAFYRDNNVDLTTEGAIDEVSADSILMLYDGDEKLFMEAMRNVFNGNDTQAKEGAKIYKNKLDEIIQKLKAWLRNLTGKENAEARANVEQGISELEQLRNMFEKAMGEAMTNVKNARAAKQDIATVKEGLGAGAVIQTNKNGELLLAKSKDGSTLVYSIKTYKDGGKDKLREALLRNGHTRTEIDATLAMIDDAADYLTILAAGFAKSHGYTALSDHLVADIITNLKTGKQVMHALVNNGDYPVNIDLALICKKRIAYMNLMTRLIEDGIFDLVNYKGEAIADVNDILRANGFETACLGCFVESRRLQFQAWAETIVSEWNAEVDKRKKNAKNFGFSDGRVKLSDADMDFLSEELKKAGKKNKQGNLNLGQGSAKVRIGRLLDMVPSLQQHLTVADLLTPSGLAALREYDSNIFSIVKSRYGAASPKIVQDFNPYASEIAMMTFKSVSEITSNAVKGAQEYIKQTKKDMGGIKKQPGETDAAFRKRRAEHNAKVENEAMRRYLYDIGGARIQSFSDFMIENVFDYLQITADLAANKFPLHGYTKETICLRLLGMTGAKWNGSLIAHTERSMGKEYAGLLPAEAAKDGSAILVHTEDGDYAIGFDDYARNKATGGQSFIQSIGMKDIIALQLDPRYSKNVGSITIGVSDKQILAMLDSPLFSMVIPYHASGMIPGFARRVGVDMYNDYTDYQNTSVRQLYDANGNAVDSLVDAKGEKIKIDTSFAFNAEIQKTGDARTAANNYIKWCAERHPVYDGKTLVGYATFSPKFSDSPYGTDFSRHPNYYKLLEDFNTYDCITGESAVQGPVEMIFPSESNRLSASEMEAYKQRLRDTGIFSEKEIAKYETIANKTFKELVEDEIKSRADYKVRQDAKWEKTVKEIKDKLMSEYARDNVSSEAKELSDSETQFSLRKKDPPKKTGIAYKVFYAKDGQLYPPMVANPGGAGTPVGVWLDADIGASAAPSKTGRPQVQAGGKGTNASKSSLAFRPGWHLGDLPMATQFARKNPETGVKDLFPADFVWAECEYAMDVDYQEEAMSYGYTENGKFRHSYAGLPRLPEDGYYRYRTNPNPDTVPWVITGAMRVKRILTDAETDKILRDAGVEPMKRQGGPIDLEKLGIEAGEQYSLKGYTSDGTEVYETSKDVLKLPWNERKKLFRNLMSNDYRGRTARFFNERTGEYDYAVFTDDDIGKAIYGNNKSDPAGRDAFVNTGADGGVFDLVENAKYDGSEREKGKKTKPHKDVAMWDYYVKTVQIDGAVFDMVINVRQTPSGEFVYSVQLNENENKAPAPILVRAYNHQGEMAERENGSRTDATAPMMPQNGTDVNEQFSLKGEQEMRREIERVRSEGRKAGKSKAEIESDVMAVVGPEYGQLLKTYGEIKRGEKPYREISVPRLTEEDRKVSQTVRTILEAEATPDAAVPTIQEMITKGDFSYDVYSDKEARVAAEATIRHKGFETALADWLSDVKEGKVSKKSTALGWMLYNNAATAGDLKTAMTVLNSMVQHQRSAAQALQATRILKKMAPDAQLYGIQRSVESLKEELIAKHGDKTPNLEIDEELAKKFLNAKTEEERAEAEADIYRDIGRQMPSTFADKWNAWRYLAMLGNPRTHVRNFFGNFFFAPVVITKSMTATAIESAVSFVSGGKIDRTKAMPSAKLLQAAWADYANVADQVTAGGKYNDSAMKNQHIQEGREIFKFKPLEKARKGNSALLEVEDMWFAQPHYAFALAQYCKAHGVTVDQLKNGKALGNARDYAIREAQKATYRDTNAFSQAISELGRHHGDNKVRNGIGIALDGILPFRKTPANILVRGIEYSPIGFVKGMTYDLYKVSKGDLTAAEAIDNISAGFTGTMLLGLGVYMAAQGLIRGAGGDDEKEKKFEELMGHQTYSLELPDGKSITLDWLAPEVLPLFIGVNLYEMARENKGRSNLADILSAVGNVTEPLLEMSCLQGLSDIFDSAGYASSNEMNPLVSALASAATSYLTQAFPTILGQAERSAQDVRMTTYTEKDAFLTSDLQYTMGKISAKLPGWDFNQIPYVDAWGRQESTGSKGANAANNFLNPAYTSQIETSAMEEELQRLYDATGEGSVLPSRADKKFTVNKEDKHLTAEEYVEYATEKGQMSYDMLEDLTERGEYANMDDAEKAKAVGLVYEYANAIAKTKVSDYDPTGWVAKAIEAERETGMDEMEYILYKMALEMADGEKETEQKANAISSMSSLSDAEIAFLWGTESASKAYDAGIDMRTYVDLLGDGKSVDVDKLVEAKDAGISIDTYIDYRDTLKSVDQPSESGKYGSYTNKEKAEAISSLNLKDKEIAYFWDTDEGYAALDAGVRMSKYVAFKAAMSDITADKDANGKTISGSRKNKVIALLNSMPLTAIEWDWLYRTEYKK